jgi:hypothetical protein
VRGGAGQRGRHGAHSQQVAASSRTPGAAAVQDGSGEEPHRVFDLRRKTVRRGFARTALRSEVDSIRSIAGVLHLGAAEKSGDRRAHLRVTRPFVTPFNQLLTP